MSPAPGRRSEQAPEHVGEVSLLPALPKAWPEGSVSGLRARGNIKVNIGWKDGKLISATLQSPQARVITVRYGDKTRTVKLPERIPAFVSF